ncbi:hypothetical protein ACHAXA_001019 [Cyclostephanos tholiformis]|uniref:NmrA-like domain-containing protein n=1 Tax=Cyclostephanos tholiformis TaxID=382380 RepID=A0ABD3R5J2_9STRA
MASQTYLVFSATGKQGRSVIKALAARGEAIVATSRDPNSTSSQSLLKNEGVKAVLRADFNDPDSVHSAIVESKATRVWFTTDFMSIPWHRRTRHAEAMLGKNVIDAIKRAKIGGMGHVEHVVYCSVGDADNVPEKVHHFWGKADVERYMSSQFDVGSGITWSVLRPVAFFENVNDRAIYNPLKKGSIKFITKPDVRVKFVSCEDIGKGVAALLTNPTMYAGKIVDAAGGEHTGTELAESLTEVSGTKCVYKIAMPRFLLWLFMGDLYHMTKWLEDVGYTADIKKFKDVVPDAQDSRGFFEATGQWADGEKFIAGK